MNIAEMFLTPNPYSRPLNRIKPTAIAWHYIGNPGTSAIANRNYFENLKTTHTTKASSHFIIGLEGEILQLIPCDEISYCTNQANSYTISVECCHPDSTGRFTEATYNSMVWLGRYLMQKYGIKNNIRHYDVTRKACPKWFVDHPQEWEKFKKLLNMKEDDIMLDKVMNNLGITENELIDALTNLVEHKIEKDKRPDWFTDGLYETIKKRKISDMTRLNDYATRAEVATMVNNSREG